METVWVARRVGAGRVAGGGATYREPRSGHMETCVEASGGALVRLWRGEHGLGRTYWLFGWVVALVYVLGDLLLDELDRRSSGGAWGVAAIGAGVLYLMYHVVWTVGVWRAAWVYRGPVWLAVLAVLMTVASWTDIGWSHLSGTSPSGIPPVIRIGLPSL